MILKHFHALRLLNFDLRKTMQCIISAVKLIVKSSFVVITATTLPTLMNHFYLVTEITENGFHRFSNCWHKNLICGKRLVGIQILAKKLS